MFPTRHECRKCGTKWSSDMRAMFEGPVIVTVCPDCDPGHPSKCGRCLKDAWVYPVQVDREWTSMCALCMVRSFPNAKGMFDR